MALVSLIASALCLGFAFYCALGSPLDAGPRGATHVRILLARRLGGVVGRVGGLRVTRWLVRLAPVGRLCDIALVRVDGWDPSLHLELRSREDMLSLMLAAWLVMAVVVSLLVGSPLGAVIVLAPPPIALPMWDAAERRRREQELAAEMPGIFRTLSMAMGSGETLAQAIDYVGTHGEGPAERAFLRASMRLRCGVASDEALGSLANELDAPGVGLLVTALLISQRTGSPLRELFQNSATLVERQGEFERMLSVKTAQVRLSVRIVCLLPVVMVVGLSLISVDFQKGLSTLPGMVCLIAAALMDGIALLIIRALMGGVLR